MIDCLIDWLIWPAASASEVTTKWRYITSIIMPPPPMFGRVVRLDDHTPAHRALSHVAAARTGSRFWCYQYLLISRWCYQYILISRWCYCIVIVTRFRQQET